MNIFKKFKVTFDLKNPTKRTKQKDEYEIQCLKYRIHSEFTTEHIFQTNPRHLPDKPFTPTESRKLQVKSTSENNLAFQALATEKIIENKSDRIGEKVKNVIWQSESDITKTTELETSKIQIKNPNSDTETTNNIVVKQNERQPVKQPKKGKGILKKGNEKVNIEEQTNKQKVTYNEDNFPTTSFGYEDEEITYEHYGTIDDQLEAEDIYYSEQKVHKTPTVRFDESDNEYEEPISARQNMEEIINPLYNLSTHPKLNPSFQDINDEENAKSIGLNTFGNSQKLNYPSEYSLEAASIFFDSEIDYDC